MDSAPTAVNPCYDGSHTCDTTARCHPGTGVDYTCECTPGFQGDGRSCVGERHVPCFCRIALIFTLVFPASQSVGDKNLWPSSGNDFSLRKSECCYVKAEAESG